jgi:hypothetical protein
MRPVQSTEKQLIAIYSSSECNIGDRVNINLIPNETMDDVILLEEPLSCTVIREITWKEYVKFNRSIGFTGKFYPGAGSCYEVIVD